VAGIKLDNYTGILTGSFFGVVYNTNGFISGGSNSFTASYFSGSVSGSINGMQTGSSIVSNNFSGSLVGYSGNILSYSINGFVSSSLVTSCFSKFTGVVTSSIGNATGYLTGDETKNKLNYSVVDTRYMDRSLIKFDLSFISQSIVLGDITNPKFSLKFKSAKSVELPTAYKIYTFPVSQSWNQGDGYWSDGGSDVGVNWQYRDYNLGTPWVSSYKTTPIDASLDYLSNYGCATESFMRGGGTWYNIPCTQSFSYQMSDINMDVTPIVNSWLSNTIPNEGLILMFSGETNISSSNTEMFFFSRETNTIFSPVLDVSWDDSSWETGSLVTGSVEIKTYNPILSGSIIDGTVIGNVSASGSFYGNAYLVLDVDNNINNGSLINIVGSSNTIFGVNIDGLILGSSSVDSNTNIRYITASLVSGYFSGSNIYAQYSSSMITGNLTGSFNGNLLTSYQLTGNITDFSTQIIKVQQNSPLSGNLIGSVVTSTINGGVFNGVSTDGVLQGGSLEIPFTGSFSYVTSSFSFTSSIEITGSSIQPLDIKKPFVVIIQDLKKEYSFGDIPRINVFGREHYPLKTFGKSNQQPVYTTPKYLPTSSYYSIKDNETNEIIVDFDDFTKLSCDTNGNYFYLDTTGLAQERYYRILIRVDGNNGDIYTFDAIDIFKVKR
jgi:hypothetical protein